MAAWVPLACCTLLACYALLACCEPLPPRDKCLMGRAYLGRF